MEKGASYDVIICGAGPAGSTGALALAGSGLRVALIDKSTFPRDKVCGDAIAAYARKVLMTIHPDFAHAFDQYDKRYLVNTYRVVGPDGRYIEVKSREQGMIAQRKHWDHFLFDLAAAQSNITPLLNTKVLDIKKTATGRTVVTDRHTLTAPLVIGCDGAHSVATRKLTSDQKDLRHHSAAVRAYFSNVTGFNNNTFELHFLKELLPGYFWLFPLNNNMANIGIGMLSAHVSQRKTNLRKTLIEMIRHHPTIKHRFVNATQLSDIEGFGLPLGSRKVTMSGDGFMLCGDAASLIDPLTGEGIGPAMVSGRYAGWHAKKCFEANNFSAAFMEDYDRQVHNKFLRQHRKSRLIQQYIMQSPRLINGIIRTANANSIVHRWLSTALT